MSGYGNPPTTSTPAAPRRSASLGLPQLIGYAAGVLGLLSFIWGFLSWFTVSEASGRLGAAGYSFFGSGAGAAIGLSIAAGAIAAVHAFEKKPVGAVPAALALAAFLVSLGLLIGKSPSGVDVGVGVGLILTLITTFVQVIGLAFVWLLAIGRVHVPQRPAASGRRPAQQQDPYGAGAGMAGPGAPPPGQFPPQPPPGGYAPPAQPQYGPPPSYGSQYAPPPPEPPMVGYGPPPATSSPGTPPGGGAPGPGSAPPPPPPPPGERPGTQWSPQTSYPGSRQEQGPPEPEDGGANP